MPSAKGPSPPSPSRPAFLQMMAKAALSSLQMRPAALRMDSETIPRFNFCHTRFITDFRGQMHSVSQVSLPPVTQSSRFLNATSFELLIHWMTIAGGYPHEMYKSFNQTNSSL